MQPVNIPVVPLADFTTHTVRTPVLLGLQNVSRTSQDLADWVLSAMGLTIPEVGFTRAGTPRYLSVVSNALGEMDSDGLVALSGYNWSLTDKGRQVASWCRSTGQKEHQAIFSAQTLTFWAPPHVPEVYSDDPHVNAMAFAQQPCAGKYNPLENTCNNPLNPCPFVGDCARATAESFAKTFIPVEAQAEVKFKLFHLSHELKVSKFVVVCEGCHNTVSTGSEVVVIPGKGTVHKGCYQAYWKSSK
jgi:hypothetical protein